MDKSNNIDVVDKCCWSVKVAEAALSRLQHFPSLHWKVEEAELFWARGELETAKHMMKTLVDDLETVCFICICICFMVMHVKTPFQYGHTTGMTLA